jgi:hypothetical protein
MRTARRVDELEKRIVVLESELNRVKETSDRCHATLMANGLLKYSLFSCFGDPPTSTKIVQDIDLALNLLFDRLGLQWNKVESHYELTKIGSKKN